MKPRLIRILFFGLMALTLWCTPTHAAADSKWWESKQRGTPTDRIVVGDKTFKGKPQSASRTNWEDGYIEVMAGATSDTRDTVNMGHAFSVALKTARHLAYEKLAETVTGLNLYSDATYDRELMMDSNLRTVLRAMVRNARVVREEKKQFNDGSIWVEVTLGMILFGNDGLSRPSMEWAARNPVKLQPAPLPAPVQTTPASKTPSAPVTTPDIAYTGLIIDATGLGASPAMLPKILSADGDILYGTGKIDKNYVMKIGLMGYQNTLSKARTQERVGNLPLIVKASGLAGKNKTDFILSHSDANKVRAAVKKHNFLKECRVVAVIN